MDIDLPMGSFWVNLDDFLDGIVLLWEVMHNFIDGIMLFWGWLHHPFIALDVYK